MWSIWSWIPIHKTSFGQSKTMAKIYICNLKFGFCLKKKKKESQHQSNLCNIYNVLLVSTNILFDVGIFFPTLYHHCCNNFIRLFFFWLGKSSTISALYLFIALRIKLSNIYSIIILHRDKKNTDRIYHGKQIMTTVFVIGANFLIYQRGVGIGGGGRDAAYFNQIVMKCISITKSACKHVNTRE